MIDPAAIAAQWAAYLSTGNSGPSLPTRYIFCTRCQVGSTDDQCFNCGQPYDRTYMSFPSSTGSTFGISVGYNSPNYPGPTIRDMLQAPPGPLPQHFHDVYNGLVTDDPEEVPVAPR